MTNDPMAPLRNRFALRCRTHLAELNRHRAAVPPLPEGEDGENFHRLVHSIAGAAGMFGFPEAGDKAAEVEAALLDEPVDAGEVARRLDRLIADIEQIARAAQEE